MNQEAVFALKFVVKDLAKMQRGIDTVNKNLEKLNKTVGKGNKNFNKQTKEVNKLNQSFAKAARGALKFALAYVTVQKIFNTAMKNANESLQLHLMADMAGVAAEKVNKLGRALLRYSGDAKSAGSAYRSLSDIIGGATHGMGISEDVSRVNAMYGIGINYGNISEDELMTNIAVAMNRLKNNGDTWGIRQIASAYGLDDAMADFLATEGANWAAKRDTYEAPLTEREAAVKQVESLKKLEDQIDKLVNKIMPHISHVIDLIAGALEIAHDLITGETEEKMKKIGEKNTYEVIEKSHERREAIEKQGWSITSNAQKSLDARLNARRNVSSGWLLSPTSHGRKKGIETFGADYYYNKDYSTASGLMEKFVNAQTFQDMYSIIKEIDKQNRLLKEHEDDVYFSQEHLAHIGYGFNKEGNMYIDVGGVYLEDKSGTMKGRVDLFEKAVRQQIFQRAAEESMKTLNPSLVK